LNSAILLEIVALLASLALIPDFFLIACGVSEFWILLEALYIPFYFWLLVLQEFLKLLWLSAVRDASTDKDIWIG